MISVRRILNGVAPGALLFGVALISTGCGGDPKWSYIDEGGNRWPVADSVATARGKVLLLNKATRLENCAIRAAVDAIAPVAVAHPEYDLTRHDPKYVFARGQNDTIPTMCYSDGDCVKSWGLIPSWGKFNYWIDGFYHNAGNQHELILIRGFEMPSMYGTMDFPRLLYVVIHEEVHGLGRRYYHGEEMDRVIGLIYSEALNNLSADPGCRDMIPNWTWEKGRSAGSGDEVRRPVD